VPPLQLGVLRARRCRGQWRLAKQGGDGGNGAGAKDRATGQTYGKPPGGQALSSIWGDQLSLILVGSSADEDR
jgi:hypothetical protein